MTPAETKFLRDSAQAIRAYERFLRRFGVLNVQTDEPSEQLLRLRAKVQQLNTMATELQEMAAS